MLISDWSSDVCSSDLDLETGVCRAATSRFSIRTTVAHPDSGCRIEGLALPYWDLVKASAVKAHRFLPFARSLGWDIAFGIEGPIILEVNGSWYYNRVQMTGRSLWETEFGSRSEEHTSELQSLMRISYAVFCLKKKNT